MKAGGPYTMSISGKNKIVLKDILIGDVWLCSGQSNMVHQMDVHDVTYAEDISSANYPAIRHFKIPTAANPVGPDKDVREATWESAVSVVYLVVMGLVGLVVVRRRLDKLLLT